MPNISDLSFYNGTHTGAQIDNAIDTVEQRGTSITNGGNGLVTSGAVYASVANEIIKVVITGLTGAGQISVMYNFPSPTQATTYQPQITAEHEVIGVEFSSQDAVMGYWEIIPGANSLGLSGAMSGIPSSDESTTDVTIWLGRVGGSLSPS